MTIDLSGEWEFCLDADKVGIENEYYGRALDDTIMLPTTTAEAKKGIRGDAKETGYLTETYHFEGYAWYSRMLEIPEEHVGDLVQLVIERTRISYVWLDDRFVGTQDSFAVAHKYDLTEYLTKMSHRLTVMVSNVDYKTPGGHMTSPDTQTNWNGMLGRIALELEPVVRVENLCVTARAESRNLELRFNTKFSSAFLKGNGALSVEGKDAERVQAHIECYPIRQGKTTIEDGVENTEGNIDGAENDCYVNEETLAETDIELELPIQSGVTEHTIQIGIPTERHIALWNEYTPNLYEVTVSIVRDGQYIMTQISEIIGFRDLNTEERTFYLNDLPVMLRGKHDGMIFPLTGYAPMDKDSWKKLFGIAKEYGINHYRFHTCCPPEAAFSAADEVGIYLAPELPFWGTVAGEQESDSERAAREWLLQEGFRILQAFGNHPSFVIFSLGNELWGNQEVLNDILGQYKAADSRHWYVQGSNNFQFCPAILENDDFFSGVRFAKERLFRGSYAMCDAPQGHIQVNMPDNCHSYDEFIYPMSEAGQRIATESLNEGETEKITGAKEAGAAQTEGEIEIQYGTRTKKVRAQAGDELVPHVPVVSHEIGQYEVYPDYTEIEKYTGVLQPENLRIFRSRLEEKGMLHMAERFFRASGHLAVECYKRELETAFRSRELSGFQLLDLQDFTGQGTALVGILNAFMENKGLVSAEEWRQFCNDRVIMLSFPTYVYQAGEQFAYEILLCDMRPDEETLMEITVELAEYCGEELADGPRHESCAAGDSKSMRGKVGKVYTQAVHNSTMELTRLKSCGCGSLTIPDCAEPKKYRVTVTVTECEANAACSAGNLGNIHGNGESKVCLSNHYDIYVYPAVSKIKLPGTSNVLVTSDKAQMLDALRVGKKVLYFGSSIREEMSIEGTYCTDFWCYPMFASISESMGRPLPVGTMGLCMDKNHPMFTRFPTDGCTTPQWWRIVTDTRIAILDGQPVEPLIWMIDNFGRNHKLGLVYEAKVGEGSLLVCQSNLSATDSPEVNWLYNSLLTYAESEDFKPRQEIDVQWLDSVY